MSTTVQNNTRSFTAGEALEAYLLVKVDSAGSVVLAAAAADQPIAGFTNGPAANGAAVNVSLAFGGGSTYGVANEAIAAGDFVYSAADGKLTSSVVDHTKVGIALDASTADGDVIEVLVGK